LEFSPEQLSRAIKAGDLRVQVGSPENEDFVVTIPKAYIEAAAEIASEH
jgi:hypothetical protein